MYSDTVTDCDLSPIVASLVVLSYLMSVFMYC